jgi:hypothetical protein
MQDMDAIFFFNYDLDGEPGKINGFFDYANHPTKMANLIPAALMFRRGDVPPADQEAVVGITEEVELDRLVESGSAWSMVDYGNFTGQPLAAYQRRVAVDFSDEPPTDESTQGRSGDAAGAPVSWPIDQEQSSGPLYFFGKSGLGYVGAEAGMQSRGDIPLSLEAGAEPWQTAVLVRLDDKDDAPDSTKRALLVATGRYANTGWDWTNDARNSLGTNWGTAPTLVEIVPVTLSLKADVSAKAWALDATGKRVEEVDVEMNDGNAIIRVGPGHTDTATLFYEIEWD